MGYAFGSIEEMGDGVFRKVRQELGVTAFGMNVLVLPPGIVARPHYHEEQDEVYFVHRGRARFALPGESRELGEDGLRALVVSRIDERNLALGDGDHRDAHDTVFDDAEAVGVGAGGDGLPSHERHRQQLSRRDR